MSATDELRRLLDERGVKWGKSGSTVTTWRGSVCSWIAIEDEDGLALAVAWDYLTPAQAVEATLGRGPCRMERDNAWSSDYEWRCTECGEHVSTCNEPPKWCPNCGRKVER